MRLVALSLILNIQLQHIFATFPKSLRLPARSNHDLDGYECGNVFFTNFEVYDALRLGLASLDEGFNYPQRYQGKLYSESKLEEYFLYPISKHSRILPQTKYPVTTFRVVFTRGSDEAVDVIDKITTDDYTRCIRRDSSHIEPSHSELEKSNGYLCGHEFFTDEILRQSLALAQISDQENFIYPCPYFGLLYRADSGHLLWPIKSGNELYRFGKARVEPYYLILSKEKQLVDVVIKGPTNNFLRCIRSRQSLKIPVSKPHSKQLVPPPKSGFLCGRTFFDENVLKKDAEIAKSQARGVKRSQFPKKHFGPPYNEKCLIWPICKDGSLYKRGSKGPYRFILTPDYKVMGVAVWVGDRLKACDKKTIIAEKNHDTSDYQCCMERFSHQQLVEAAEEACVKMNASSNNIYPASYEGPGFNSEAPYFTYPVLQE
ncbi:hypothetical protein EPUL_005323, partial [Erysiphe pulchra]